MKVKEIIKFFKTYFQSEKRYFYLATIFVFISSIVGVLLGYLIGLAIDLVSASHFSLAVLTFILYGIMELSDYLIFNRLGNIYLKKLANNMMEKIGYQVYYKVGLLPARAFEEKSSGEIINRVVNDSSTITEIFTFLIRIGMALFSSLVVFIYIWFNSKIVALEVIIYLGLIYFFSKIFLPAIKEREKVITKEKDAMVASVNESIRGIREIRALGIRKKHNEIVKNNLRNIFYNSNKQMITDNNYNAFISMVDAIFETTVFITIILLLVFHKTSFAFFMAITYYVYRFMATINQITTFSSSWQKMRVAIERIDEILNNKSYADLEFGTVHKMNIKGNIEFKNITFKYSEKEAPIFTNLNLELVPHKKIAIVGKSGQGKSSLFNLLLRYFPPNEGTILMDGIPIEQYDEESFNTNIAIIRQEPFIFNKTILANFLIIDENLTLEEIRKFCKMAQIDDYIMSLPDKYDTMLGEGGINLSGGQKQRLAIARALVKNSKILLFDEATSALDNESQAKIKKAIDNLVKNHTIIIIAHRLSTIIDADIIYVMNEGKIVASGTHKELMKKSKLYQSLYKEEI